MKRRFIPSLVGLAWVALISACSNDPDAQAARGEAGAGGSIAGSGAGGSAGGLATSGGRGGASAQAGAFGGGAGGSSAAGGSGGIGGASTTCGSMNQGEVLVVAPDIELCLPKTVCVPETCPPELGECSADGRCVFHSGYQGLATLPEAWATQYCDLNAGACNGVSQLQPPLVTATEIAMAKGYPLCAAASAGQTCVGIVASPPMMVGNSEVAVDPATGEPAALWGLGLTEASGLCYEVTGPGGSALVAITDRCAGYCRCGGSSTYEECGACVNASDLHPKCPCVGSVPSLYESCCVRGEPLVCGPRPEDDALPQCDWCASNNHPHFDLDDATFLHVCGAEADKGSCRLERAMFVACRAPDPSWPPNR